MTEDEIISTFQANRKIGTTRGMPLFLVGFAGFGVGLVSLASPATHWLGLAVTLCAPIPMVVGILIFARTMRCPACGKAVRDGRGRILVDPATCPRCGVRLR